MYECMYVYVCNYIYVSMYVSVYRRTHSHTRTNICMYTFGCGVFFYESQCHSFYGERQRKKLEAKFSLWIFLDPLARANFALCKKSWTKIQKLELGGDQDYQEVERQKNLEVERLKNYANNKSCSDKTNLVSSGYFMNGNTYAQMTGRFV